MAMHGRFQVWSHIILLSYSWFYHQLNSLVNELCIFIGKNRVGFYNEHRKTIQSETCSVLIPKADNRQRCGPCEVHRQSLNRILYRMLHEQGRDQNRTACDSHTNYRCLTPDETSKRLKNFHQESVRSKRQISQLKDHVEKLIEERSAPVEKDLDDHLTEIATVQSSEIEQLLEEGTFGRAFWNAQKRALTVKHLCGMRWDPVMIRWCLYLRHLAGSSAYEMLRESGAITLPSQRTLRDYTYYTKTRCGFGDDVDQQLMEVAHIRTCPEREKYVILVMDEMHIKEDIVYDKHTGTELLQLLLGVLLNLLSYSSRPYS